MTHTPGPWEIDAGRCIRTQSGSFTVHASDDWNRNWAELDANARLIAASPRLLKALQGLMLVVANSGFEDEIDEGADRGDNLSFEAQTIITEARAAIEEATSDA